jgi:hypothetical protein
MIFSLSIFLTIQNLKKTYFKELIIRKIDSQIGKEFELSNDLKRFISNGNTDNYVLPYDPERLQADFKLVYLINFDCSVCIVNLIQIYNFYHELQNVHKIEFCLITEEKSDSYIRYWLDQSVKDYNLLVIRQEITYGNSNLFLLDNSNKIVMAGDIIKYPFLKTVYIKKLREAINQQMISSRNIISTLSSRANQLIYI